MGLLLTHREKLVANVVTEQLGLPQVGDGCAGHPKAGLEGEEQSEGAEAQDSLQLSERQPKGKGVLLFKEKILRSQGQPTNAVVQEDWMALLKARLIR